MAIAALFFSFYSFTSLKDPQNWFKAGSNPHGYVMELDSSEAFLGSSSAKIMSKDKRTSGFGTLMQSCSAKNYIGKKIKLSGYVKTTDVKKWSGLWLRVDGPRHNQVLSFDNMRNRAIKGTTDWTKYEIVLDVPDKATTLNFGALIKGGGTLWFDNLEIEILEDLESKKMSNPQLEAPRNLNFEH